MIVNQNKIEKLAAKARKSVSSYCSSECKSYCCRKGYLILSGKEASLVLGAEIDKLQKEKIVTLTNDGKFLFNLGVKGCPMLHDFKCKIHGHADRPKACREFPIFLWANKKVKVSDRCPASKENRFYKYLWEFKSLGYTEK
jgi:Fe-S-cluster containining protein